jgi:hypothetical protein
MLVVALPGCMMGPSDEQVRCYQVCARDKDACMLSASTAEQIQSCDARGSRCTESCGQ